MTNTCFGVLLPLTTISVAFKTKKIEFVKELSRFARVVNLKQKGTRILGDWFCCLGSKCLRLMLCRCSYVVIFYFLVDKEIRKQFSLIESFPTFM